MHFFDEPMYYSYIFISFELSIVVTSVNSISIFSSNKCVWHERSDYDITLVDCSCMHANISSFSMIVIEYNIISYNIAFCFVLFHLLLLIVYWENLFCHRIMSSSQGYSIYATQLHSRQISFSKEIPGIKLYDMNIWKLLNPGSYAN